MIVTFCPSSRRLAMRPPQERATSSGCGATKTWVMAAPSISTGTGPDSEPATPALISPPTFLGEPARADQWDEHDGTVGRLSPVIAVADDERQHLVIAGPDR